VILGDQTPKAAFDVINIPRAWRGWTSTAR
jgi:hypothetical protein